MTSQSVEADVPDARNPPVGRGAGSPELDIPPELLVHTGIARPGDTIIVAYSRHLTEAEIDHIGQMVDEYLPGLKVALFEGVSSVTMYRPTAGG